MKHYHLIGIGGIGMSGIAQLLLCRGFQVSGSDLKETNITEGLRKQGARIFIGQSSAHLSGADLAVYSSAISQDNPEITEARRRGIPLIKRAQALADLMQDEIVITVSGSHGKTTTASLASYLLLESGLKPTVAIGGILKNIDTNACLGGGSHFVAEADESDGSFLYYRPKYSIVTNIDKEHLDYYKEFRNQIDAFREFLNNTKEDGCIFACSEDEHLAGILKDCKRRFVLFGLSGRAQIYPKNINLNGLTSQFDCFYEGKFLDRINLPLGGMHNISNALSVIGLGLELGIGLEIIKSALCGYKGSRRRLEVKFRDDDYSIIDDYAHHPTEIKATLSAAKNLNPKRLIAVFQPHRYSRTKLLLEEFAASFSLADRIILTDIYPAGEEPLDGVSARLIFDKIKEHAPGKEILYMPKEEIAGYLTEILNPGDLVMTLGAGDIVKVGDELVQKIKG